MLLVQVVVQAGLSICFIRRSQAAASVCRKREEGVVLSVLLGVFYVAYSVGIVAYLLCPAWMAWGSLVDLAVGWRWLGVVPLAAGTALAMWGLRTLGRHFALSVSPQDGNTLVRSGPYRWVRHPLYAAFLVEAVGVSLVMASWFVGLMAVLLWGAIAYRTPMEEDKLLERHGDAYREYIATTGRFLPRFRSVSMDQISR